MKIVDDISVEEKIDRLLDKIISGSSQYQNLKTKNAPEMIGIILIYFISASKRRVVILPNNKNKK